MAMLTKYCAELLTVRPSVEIVVIVVLAMRPFLPWHST
jgi:hypothetical protein